MTRQEVDEEFANCETEYGWNYGDIDSILNRLFEEQKLEMKSIQDIHKELMVEKHKEISNLKIQLLNCC